MEQSSGKTNINWYPGHMAKTKKQILEDLKLIDIVIELLDARNPVSSRNPDIQELTKGKKKIILLNKCDLADEKINQAWVKYLEKEAPTLLTDSNSGKGIEKVFKKIDEMMLEEIEHQKQRGIFREHEYVARQVLLAVGFQMPGGNAGHFAWRRNFEQRVKNVTSHSRPSIPSPSVVRHLSALAAVG